MIIKIREIQLIGEKLEKDTSNLDVVEKVCSELYKNNLDLIKEYIPENWYAVIEPLSGKLIASNNQIDMSKYISSTYPSRIFYVIGLLKVDFDYARCVVDRNQSNSLKTN